MDFYSELEKAVKKNRQNLVIEHRHLFDRQIGGSFHIDADRNSRIIVDTRELQRKFNENPNGSIDVLAFMNMVAELLHEAAHYDEYAVVFKDESDEARKLASAMLFGRYFPEYRRMVVTYLSNPVELYAEKAAWEDTHDIFLMRFESNGFTDAMRDSGEEPVEALIRDAMQEYSPWLREKKFRTVDKGLEVLQEGIDAENTSYRPETMCLTVRVRCSAIPFLPGRESKMRRDIKADAKLHAEFIRSFDQGGSRATQWALMEQYVRDHPSKDLKLFPNLAYLVPEGVDLDKLPSLEEINRRLGDYGPGTRRMPDISGVDLSDTDPILVEFSHAGWKRIHGDKSPAGAERGGLPRPDVGKSGKDDSGYVR